MRPSVPVLLLAACVSMAPAYAQTEVQRLQQQLLERDTLIRDLLRRVEALEQKSRAPVTTSAAPTAAQPAAPPPSGGSLDEEGMRALERALVRQGGLVLPAGAMELETRYQYTLDGRRGLAILQTPAGPQVTESTDRRHRHEAALGLRIGLPWASQLDVRVPYVQVRATSSAAALGLDQADRITGAGDAEVQFTRQLADERAGRPALLGSVTWKAANGEYRPGQASPGSGFTSIQAALTVVKRQDPLVFFGGLSYTAYRSRTYEGDHMAPGRGIGVRLGTLLAASPQSSLRIGLELAHAGRTRFNGVAAAGSDTLSGMVELGLASVLTRTTSLDFSVGFGVTPDAPRLRVGIAFPVRLD